MIKVKKDVGGDVVFEIDSARLWLLQEAFGAVLRCFVGRRRGS